MAVTVTCVDNPPVAVDDTATVAKDVSAATIDVLSNDTDTDGGPISIASVTQPTNGAVVITNAGADLTYQPSAGYCNDSTPTDDFTYTLTPGGSTATVAVTVTCVDDPPFPDVPTLTVIKTVVNDDGGSALASDWTMDVSGTNVSGTGFAGSASKRHHHPGCRCLQRQRERRTLRLCHVLLRRLLRHHQRGRCAHLYHHQR